jgi:alpha-tubulin suppressor-like RCC1 family protein
MVLNVLSLEIPDLLKAKKVACGQRHGLVLIGTDEGDDGVGQVWGWGDNRHGQIGCDPATFTKISHLTPVKTLANIHFSELKSGWSHAAAITGDFFFNK